jgi:cobalamin synthase
MEYQSSGGGEAIVMVLAIGVGLVVGIAISAVVCFLLYTILQRIPPEHRQQEPAMVWLLLIPCFNLVWNFFVFPKVSDSFKSYFTSVGDETVGDCSRTLSMAYCIVSCLCIIPCLNYLAGPACLVLLIIVLVQFWGFKNRIPEGS